MLDQPPGAQRWSKPEHVQIDDRAEYLVKTNGSEWRDPDMKMMPGIMVRKLLEPQIVRGRPIWVARINRPKEE